MGRVQGEGRVVHLTGQVAWNASDEIVGAGDVMVQAEQCFDNIEALLTEVGGELTDLVSVTTYYTAQDQLPLIQKVRQERLAAKPQPVSTSVMVAGLGHPDFLVELTAIAVVADERFREPAG
jgi:enamine deaminase RidA (YjgF/YER057c/UK114 family)